MNPECTPRVRAPQRSLAARDTYRRARPVPSTRRGQWRLIGVAGAALLALTVSGRSLAAQGTITGRVTSEGVSEPLAGAHILVIGTNLMATASEDGAYTLRSVRAGIVELQVLLVGYKSLKKTVTVTSGATTETNFTMARAVVQLDEIVTTATGQQRRTELGNAISTLVDVGKRVEQTEVASIADLLVAKIPGMVVLPGSVIGAAPTVRMRGISSINLSNAPIWYLDGVRYITASGANSAGQTPISLLNNLSPEEIEDIEIVRGPSAATLYGTNAANGIIIVTTKRGRAGSTRWTWIAESRTIDDRNPYQAQYANWGHSPANPTMPIRCQLATMQTPAFTTAQGATCISDSLTSYNLLTDPDNTFIKLGRGSLYGFTASGGTEAVRFFVSGHLDNEFGPVQMPAADIRYYDDVLHVPVTNPMFHPRQQQKMNFRTNLTVALSPQFDLAVNTGFGKSSNIIEPDNTLLIALLYTGQASFGFKGMGACPIVDNKGCLEKPVLDPTGFPLHDYIYLAPGSIMQYVSTDDVQRFTGSSQASWRPYAWLKNDGTVGVDLAVSDQFHVCKLNECPNSGALARVGNVTAIKENRRNFSAKVSSAATWQVRSWANLETSVGADYTNEERDQESAQGRTLPIGGSTLAATSTFVNYGYTSPTAVKTLGYYAQEQLSLRDRLFFIGAARADQNSAFGTNFQHVLYPKVSVSWVVTDEAFVPKPAWMDAFRLRGAFGANGVQPGATDAFRQFTATTTSVAGIDKNTGTDVPGLVAANPGNAELRPEKSSELEAGFETDLLGHRLRLDYTFYQKRTFDALINVPVPPSVAAPMVTSNGAIVTSLLQNVGKTQNWGHEFQAHAVLVDRRRLAWDVTVSASHNNNEWIDLGIDPGTGAERVIGAGLLTEQRNGFPLHSQWYRNFTFNDANGDGVIQVSEVQVDSALSYHGIGFAKDIASVQSVFDLFQHRVRVNMLFDYRAGGNTLEGNYFQCTSTPQACRETQDPTAPLWMQARAVALKYGTKLGASSYTTRLGYFSPAQFWKFRELSVVLTLPGRVSSSLRAQNGSTLVVGLRNLHTWTRFTGVDPEENYGVGATEVTNDFNTSPPPTYITFRLNLKY